MRLASRTASSDRAHRLVIAEPADRRPRAARVVSSLLLAMSTATDGV